LKEKGTFDEPGLGRTQGKGDCFPLLDESSRVWSSEGDLDQEKRALLNPCIDDPEFHLEFNLVGEVSPKPGSRMGEASIKICALTRHRLKQARCQALQSLKRQLQGIRERDEREHILAEFQRDDHEFAGFFRSVIVSFNLADAL
jgi:hypothetical protein